MTGAEWWNLVPERYRERPEFAYVGDDRSLPRVLLLGDSISMSYTVPVRRLLAGVAAVHRAPTNCRSTRQSVSELGDYIGDGNWRVIHCNWGIHDITQPDDTGACQVSVDEYGRNLEGLFSRLVATGATLIWASTTPVQEGTPKRSGADVVRYNLVAEKIVRARGIVVNDLYSLVVSCLISLQPTQNVHFTDYGAQILAGQVARSIRDTLRVPTAPPSSACG